MNLVILISSLYAIYFSILTSSVCSKSTETKTLLTKTLNDLLLLFTPSKFFTSALADDLTLSDSKSPQVSRTVLSILAVLNNVVVWMVSTRPPISKSPSHFNNILVTVPKTPITVGIITTFMVHIF